ncbi:hypothetical protein BGX38DRAFT_50638 [Terfezia claveryi]|nr:hypothetical protein BGX38DRAFT_50638 [Terfezia claveryi]
MSSLATPPPTASPPRQLPIHSIAYRRTSHPLGNSIILAMHALVLPHVGLHHKPGTKAPSEPTLTSLTEKWNSLLDVLNTVLQWHGEYAVCSVLAWGKLRPGTRHCQPAVRRMQRSHQRFKLFSPMAISLSELNFVNLCVVAPIHQFPQPKQR